MSSEITSDRDLRPTADRLHSLAIHLLRRLRVVDTESGIGPSQLSALSVLVFGGPRSLTELAAAEQVTAATMSRLVSAMHRAGLVRRQTVGSDRRRQLLTPTAKGRRILQAGRERRVLRLAEALEALSEEELKQLTTLVTLLQQVVQKI